MSEIGKPAPSLTRGRELQALLSVIGFVLVWTPGCAQAPAPESGTPDLRDQDITSPSHPPESQTRPDYGYELSTPDAEFKLDNDLVEISGLTVFDEGHLAAVEDEHGRFYVIDFETGNLDEVHRFAAKDDYEGIEMAGKRLFALRSDGQIREIEDYDTDDPDSDKIKTPLGAKCDAEGLAFDADRNRLLIACKEYPGKGLKRKRAIYALDLESMELSDRPVYTISTREVSPDAGSAGDAIKDFVYPLVDLDGFKPSALAIHPVTKDIFVLSSVLKVIVVLTQDGSIRAILPLDKDMLEQPEGMAFLPNGDLFISSEGVRRKARLVRFNYRPSR
ncbi:MAG: SdiA-regulated domain-containing protein [Rhodothermia bacterium]